ncbi:MAG TPA: N-acetylneuraminate synthase family protein, partial [Terriglobia bacterium]|nr:N-acetylneuraminate synthase family protein [Terriglobia bacterium]
IGYDEPCYIIAEGCDNHLGNLIVAKEMALQAKLAGADAIKFQHHLPDEEMLPDVPMSSNFKEPLYEFLKKYALKLDQHQELMRYCKEIGIQYLCTPFSYKAAEEMNGLGLEAIKIGSGEMTDVPSLVRMAKSFGRPMVVSTGMSTFEEIDRTYHALADTNIPLALMNCVSEYPPRWEDVNLLVIPQMIKRYPKAIIGHSDHTPDIYTCFAAVTLGAKLIEKHVIIDKRQPGPDQSVSIDFRDLASLVDGVRKIEAALGEQKSVKDLEKPIRKWAFRSIVTTCDIPAGKVINGDMIWSKRPGTGIPSHLREKVIGRRSLRPIKANVLLSWDDIDGTPAQ